MALYETAKAGVVVADLDLMLKACSGSTRFLATLSHIRFLRRRLS